MMAYGDYGGVAYRAGNRVDDRSDAVLSPEGIKSTPGAWPGWTIPEGRAGGSYHALLGDGPIFVGLYKQGYVTVHRLGEEIDAISRYGDGDERSEWQVDWDGHLIELRWTNEDNHYCYARVTQPDGVIWHGWSGYGVGAGFEGGDYGYSSRERDETLVGFWPEAILRDGVGRAPRPPVTDSESPRDALNPSGET